MKFFGSFIKSLVGFLFPPRPRVLVLEALTPEKLLSKLPRAAETAEKNVQAIFDYSHPLVKELVWEIKYGGNRTLSNKLGKILYDSILEELMEDQILEKHKTVILMPMPISGKRRFERGWNQAELLAAAIKSNDIGNVFKYMPGQLVKTRHTESQTKTSSRSERMKNLLGSMSILNPNSVSGRLVVLIDDVTTTGASFAEAKRALKEAGTKKIMCVAVSH